MQFTAPGARRIVPSLKLICVIVVVAATQVMVIVLAMFSTTTGLKREIDRIRNEQEDSPSCGNTPWDSHFYH